MILIYGSRSCFTCMALSVFLRDRNADHSMYFIGEDILESEVRELYPDFNAVPFIIENGKEISLVELEQRYEL